MRVTKGGRKPYGHEAMLAPMPLRLSADLRSRLERAADETAATTAGRWSLPDEIRKRLSESFGDDAHEPQAVTRGEIVELLRQMSDTLGIPEYRVDEMLRGDRAVGWPDCGNAHGRAI